ncbi:MAG TPA: alpha/beta hydrolase [Burkholderiaceae bacterium]|jgi:pimeloyl-ACP methyl ester carboxylesterase|nr:alpha/beta hydrolase [Burkholderiaceae bacterium]
MPEYVEAAGARLEYAWFGGAACEEAVVLLHEGLGSVALWRDFPQRLADNVGRPVLAYSRRGYGGSDPLRGPRGIEFMHDEARDVLPQVLRHFGIVRPLLVGHSDGASIALIHAGSYPDVAAAVVALAPHVFVEPITIASIASISRRFAESDLPARMSRYHADPVQTFRGWADVWLDPQFAHWNIEAIVAASRCPILAVQGRDDEYGTMRQVERIAELRSGTRIVELADCGHSPHQDQPQRVLEAIGKFVADVLH